MDEIVGSVHPSINTRVCSCAQVVSLEIQPKELVHHCESMPEQPVIAKRLRRVFSLYDNKDVKNDDDDSDVDGNLSLRNSTSRNDKCCSVSKISSNETGGREEECTQRSDACEGTSQT